LESRGRKGTAQKKKRTGKQRTNAIEIFMPKARQSKKPREEKGRMFFNAKAFPA